MPIKAESISCKACLLSVYLVLSDPFCLWLYIINILGQKSNRHLERTRKNYSWKFVPILPKSSGSSHDFKLKSYPRRAPSPRAPIVTLSPGLVQSIRQIPRKILRQIAKHQEIFNAPLLFCFDFESRTTNS